MIKINGVSYTGNNIKIQKNSIYIDTDKIDISGKSLSIEIEGNIENLNVDRATIIKCSGNIGKLKTTSGDVECIDILGNVDTSSGDIICNEIVGNVKTKSGDVSSNNIAGKVKTSSGDIKTK